MRKGFILSIKKILWISDVEGWAYNNRFNRIRKHSIFDHIQILTSGLSQEMVADMIVKENADLIIAQNPRCFQLLIRNEDIPKVVTLFASHRTLTDWAR